jgi:hypothetical protein
MSDGNGGKQEHIRLKFFSMLWSQSIIVNWIGGLEFSGTSKIKSAFWRNLPWSRNDCISKISQ